MRSLFWLGCAVVVCAASFVYLATDFACRHPDSLAVRCARAAHTMSVRCNPVTTVALAGVHAFRTASDLMWKAMTVANEAPQTSSCKPTATCQTPPTCKASQPVEVIDLSLVAEPVTKSEGVEEEAEALAPAESDDGLEKASPPPVTPPWPQPCFEGTVTVPPTPIEESEDVPSTMPPADAEEIPAPAEAEAWQPADEQMPTSPPMEDLIREQLDQTREHVFQMWFDLFQKSEEDGNESNSSAVTDEEPPSDEPGERSPATDEYKDEEKATGEEPPASAEEDQEDDPAAQEESDSVAPEKPADCQMDPNYHKQYPGCPYMGGDPATHHCPEPMTGVPTHRRPKKVKASPIIDPTPDAEEAEIPSGDAMMPFPMDRPVSSNRPRNLEATPTEDAPRHPEVDTMEFRKSDAKEGEFDSGPF